MQIVDVETFTIKLDPAADGGAYLGLLPNGSQVPQGYSVRPPWRSLYSPLFESLLVKVTASDGTFGWGEALAPVAPEVPAAVVDRLLRPVVLGLDARRPRPAWSALSDLMRERGHLVGHQADALAAVDIALWDLAGRLAGLPVCDLLGGAFRTDVPVYVSGLPATDDDGRAELAADWAGRGATAVKLHLGHGVDADLTTVAAVRAAAPVLRVAVDAHWAYGLHDALRLAVGLDDLGGWFVEAPLAPEDEDGHAELCRRSPVPIAVGEALRNRYEFDRWLGQRALHLAQPDVGRTGITEAMAIGELCAARHVPVAPHHSTGLGVVLAAGVHVSAALGAFHVFEYQPTSTQVGARIMTDSLSIRPDGVGVPTGPGLGVQVDEDAVRAAVSSASKESR